VIKPHGGKLINCKVATDKRLALLEESKSLPKKTLNSRELSDIEMIGVGAFSPLDGFMKKSDYLSVIRNMRLANGTVWSLPITLSISSQQAKDISNKLALSDQNDKVVAVMEVTGIYEYDKVEEARLVYGTDDEKHPGVAYLYSQEDLLVSGKITLIDNFNEQQFSSYRFTPEQTRKLFADKGWRQVVGFQTRNPVHRAHEYIQKCALEVVDGLLLHPLVGETKSDDIPAEVRMKCYQVLLEKYYPRDRVVLSVLPASMRYAGPREAIFHALVRKNYGCTHFIVGRDHAGVGSYYGSFEAQKIFEQFTPSDLDITPLFFDYTFYCHKCEGMASTKTCPHSEESRLSLSGTKVRQMLREGKLPPAEFSRPEVAEILLQAMKKSAELV
jgi:sulfate adenylyltransferase